MIRSIRSVGTAPRRMYPGGVPRKPARASRSDSRCPALLFFFCRRQAMDCHPEANHRGLPDQSAAPHPMESPETLAGWLPAQVVIPQPSNYTMWFRLPMARKSFRHPAIWRHSHRSVVHQGKLPVNQKRDPHTGLRLTGAPGAPGASPGASHDSSPTHEN